MYKAQNLWFEHEEPTDERSQLSSIFTETNAWPAIKRFSLAKALW